MQFVYFKHQEQVEHIACVGQQYDLSCFRLDPVSIKLSGTMVVRPSAGLVEPHTCKTCPGLDLLAIFQSGGSEDNPIIVHGEGGRLAGSSTAGAAEGFEDLPQFGPPEPTIGSGTEGIRGQLFYIPRDRLCANMWTSLSMGVVWIKAPPESGKTSSLQMLATWIRQHFPQVKIHHVNCASYCKDFDRQYPRKLGGKTLTDLMEDGGYHFVSFDEVQSIYNEEASHSTIFWATIKQLLEGGHKVYVVLAASYGTASIGYNSRGSSSGSSSGGSTGGSVPDVSPVALAGIRREQIVTVQPPGPEVRGQTLALTTEEWVRMQDKFRQRVHENLKMLNSAVMEHIYDMCSGQVGLIVACLHYINSQVVNPPEDAQLVSRMAMWELASEEFLGRLQSVRSLVRYNKAVRVEGAQDLLNKLMWHHEVVQEDGPSLAARTLQKCGIVIIAEGNKRAAVRYTSRMHRMWYTHQHYTIRAAPGSSTRAVDLLQRLLSMISSWLMRHTDSRSKEGAAPFEAFWEAEMYRVGVQSTIKGTVVSVQAGKADGAHGYLDILFGPPYKVGMELLVNGKGIGEHLRRFDEPHGRYHPLQTAGIIKEWVVVDFRAGPNAALPSLQDDHLFTVMVSADCRALHVLHKGQACFGGSIILSDDPTGEALAALQPPTPLAAPQAMGL